MHTRQMGILIRVCTSVIAMLLLVTSGYTNEKTSLDTTEDCLPKILKQYEEDLSNESTKIKYDYSSFEGEGTCKDGEPEGNWKIYYKPSGNLYLEVPYVKGKIHGTWKRYNWKRGSLLEEKTFEDGIAFNVAKMYYDTGELSREIPYDNGTANGIAKGYYKNGKIRSETPWLNDKRHGVRTTYHQNGKIKSETPYVLGLKHGVEKIYRKNGRLKEKKEYVQNSRVKN